MQQMMQRTSSLYCPYCVLLPVSVEPETPPIPISNSVRNSGSQDDASTLSLPSMQETALREIQEDTVSDPLSQRKNWEGSLPKEGGLEMSAKVGDSTSLGSHLEQPLRPTQRGPNAVLWTDSGYSSVDCSPTAQPLLTDLDSFNVVSLKGGRQRSKSGKKSSARKEVAKGKRPSIIREVSAAHQGLPGETCQPAGFEVHATGV